MERHGELPDIANVLTSGGLGAISDVAHVLPQRLF